MEMQRGKNNPVASGEQDMVLMEKRVCYMFISRGWAQSNVSRSGGERSEVLRVLSESTFSVNSYDLNNQ